MSVLTTETIGGARLAKPINDNFNAIQAWANGGIGQDNLAANAVANAELADGAVTSGKISDGNVTEGKLGVNAVTTLKVKDAAITPAKLDSSFLFGNISATYASFTPAADTFTAITGASLGTITPAHNAFLLVNYRISALRGAVAGALVSCYYRIYDSTGAGEELLVSSTNVEAAAYSAGNSGFVAAIPLTKDRVYALRIDGKHAVASQSLNVVVTGYSLLVPRTA